MNCGQNSAVGNDVQNYAYNCNDDCNEECAEVRTSEVTAVAVLGADRIDQENEPAKYGNSVQNCAPEVAPTGDGSVGLRQMLFDFSQLLSLGDLLNLCLFHNFFTLSSDLVRMFTLIDYHFFKHLSRGILLFFEKYFVFHNNIQSL